MANFPELWNPSVYVLSMKDIFLLAFQNFSTNQKSQQLHLQVIYLHVTTLTSPPPWKSSVEVNLMSFVTKQDKK